MKCLVVLAATIAVALGCGESMEGSGAFSSPNHPSNYPANSACTWTLQATAGSTVCLTFSSSFEIEDHSSCNYDYVTVTTSSGSQKFCGPASPGQIRTGLSSVTVSFSSDSSLHYPGFSASFTSGECGSAPDPPTAGPTSSPTPGCGGNFNAESGVFRSPNHPSDYENNMDCTYTITTGGGATIFKFTNMDIESHSSCDYDYVEHAGNKFCGTATKSITTTEREVTFRFVSDSSSVGKGFVANWEKLTCDYYGGTCSASCDGTTRDVPCANGGVCCVPKGECGKIPLYPDLWIIGGAIPSENAWPWQASLQTTSSDFHFCGATLVSDQYLVTAAHCVDGTSASSMKIILGEHHLTESGAESTHAIEEVIVHENYESGEGAFPNDIALLKLTDRVTFSDYVQAACLADAGDVFHTNNNCWITGWGKIDDDSSPPELRELNIDVLDQATCEEKWTGNINAGHICLGNGNSGACNGDSGGPLACQVTAADGTYFWKLAGATSWGRTGCKTEGFPSVYSRISHFREWIDSKMTA